VRRIVLDTNVFLDCWVFDDPAARALRGAVELGQAIAVRSAATDAELTDVLARSRFGLKAAARDALLAPWRSRAAPIDVEVAAPLDCADPDDQKFLDLAFAAGASVLFTRDKALLATATRARAHNLQVVLPDAARSVLLFEDRVP